MDRYEQAARCFVLREQGHSIRQIAARLHLSIGTVHQRLTAFRPLAAELDDARRRGIDVDDDDTARLDAMLADHFAHVDTALASLPPLPDIEFPSLPDLEF
ncbi:hypothetical protein BBK14_20420 [Parafrankia soli]|uniref:RNA polymerase sigma factor 70 region 4 type 2 domain-containing protein n=1 Tax=Parafrankia soli TaxID=2599596 RepID=A0A1S1Q0F0_9ACTN|nr:sigma factor-like helix-turn-helix DNA-binding protein [Parafrankia soli]OHV27440.1 hypothetical protein BBK14_20420 [Parafrankia soli]